MSSNIMECMFRVAMVICAVYCAACCEVTILYLVITRAERANWLDHPPIVPHTEFYNTALDHTDLMSEFYSWQSPQGHATMQVNSVSHSAFIFIHN